MKQTRVAKLFRDGTNQAVRLPAEFRLEGHEVYVTRDDATGDVVLSNRLGTDAWNEFFDSLHCFESTAHRNCEVPEMPLYLERIDEL